MLPKEFNVHPSLTPWTSDFILQMGNRSLKTGMYSEVTQQMSEGRALLLILQSTKHSLLYWYL